MNTKRYTGKLQVKSKAQGLVEAVFATLNVPDLDGDVTIPGAFGRQTTVIESWNHGHGLPVGRGTISERGNEAILDGQFFLDTRAGKDHFNTLLALGEKVEWSYTFNIVDAAPRDTGKGLILKRLDVVGVGPVTRGAGIATRTLVLKAASLFGQSPTGIAGTLVDTGPGVMADYLTAELDDQLTTDLESLERYADEHAPPTRYDVRMSQLLADGHTPATAQVVIASEVEAGIRRLVDLSPAIYGSQPALARTTVLREWQQPMRRE